MSSSKAFNSSNPNFIAMILVAIFGLAASAGIQFPSDPAALSDKIVNTFNGGGYFALIGVLSISIIMPVYNYIREKEYPTFREFFSRMNTITYLIFFVLSLVGLFGIPVIPTNSDDIAVAVYSKDWVSAIGLIFTSLLQPLFRYFLDRRVRIQAEESVPS